MVQRNRHPRDRVGYPSCYSMSRVSRASWAIWSSWSSRSELAVLAVLADLADPERSGSDLVAIWTTRARRA